MSPFLTGSGRWVFLTGVIFSLFGAVVGEPLLVFFGQIPFLVLFGATLSLMPAARAVDRRQVTLEIEEAEQEPLVLRYGSKITLNIWCKNPSPSNLYIQRLTPSTAGEIETSRLEQSLSIARGQARRFDLTLTSKRVGRASLQGFDILLQDRWGLMGIRDYLPCRRVLETYPPMTRGQRRRALIRAPGMDRAVHDVDERALSGMELRELRDYQPGDPLKAIAWKATARQRRLISREFEEQRSQAEYLALDISSSMRAGSPIGLKFDHALRLISELAGGYLEDGRDVALWTFDEGIYGKVEVGRGAPQLRRIQRHLVGLNSVIDTARTIMDEEEVEELLADYLQVQERLDFRYRSDGRRELDRELLRRWLRPVVASEARLWQRGGEAFGVLGDDASDARRLFRLRGIPLDPPSEVRPGAKLPALREVIRDLLHRGEPRGRLTIISDLCGLNDVDGLARPLNLVRRKGIELRILAPFTPFYGADEGTDSTIADSDASLLRDLFTRAEMDDRQEVAGELNALGVDLRFIGPDLPGKIAL